MGIKRGDYVVKVNNRKVLDGIMESIEIGGEANAGKRLVVLRAIDKLDRLGPDGVRMLLGKGRKDESGDFTKGAELPDKSIDTVLGFLSTAVNNDDETFSRVEALVSGSNQGIDGVMELRGIDELIAASGYDDGRVRIDTSVVRGLEYYTGPVYEVELTFAIKDEKGRPVRFGSVGGGGRYDGLVSRFMGQPVPATGFSIGVSRLQAALTALGKLGAKREAGPVLVTVFGAENVQASQTLTANLRKRRRPRRALSRQSQTRHRTAAQICRQARQPLRGDPGAGRKSQRRSADPRLDRRLGAERHQGSRRIPQEAGRGAVRRQGKRTGRGRAQIARAPQAQLASWRAACIRLIP